MPSSNANLKPCLKTYDSIWEEDSCCQHHPHRKYMCRIYADIQEALSVEKDHEYTLRDMWILAQVCLMSMHAPGSSNSGMP